MSEIPSQIDTNRDEIGLMSPKYFRAHISNLNRTASTGSARKGHLTDRVPNGQNAAFSARFQQKKPPARSEAGRFIFRNLDAKARFLEWLATEPSRRRPKTRQELSRQLGVGRRTLFRWEKAPQQLLPQILQANAIDRFERAMRALTDRAIDGDLKATELYLKIVFGGELGRTK